MVTYEELNSYIDETDFLTQSVIFVPGIHNKAADIKLLSVQEGSLKQLISTNKVKKIDYIFRGAFSSAKLKCATLSGCQGDKIQVRIKFFILKYN